MSTVNDPVLSPRGIARYLREEHDPPIEISPRSIDRIIKRGEMDVFLTAGGWQRVRRSEVDRWAAEHGPKMHA